MLKLDTKLKLDKSVCLAPNLTDRFEEVDLRRIGEIVWSGYDSDKRSRETWERRSAAGMDLAMQVVQTKSFPWANCANVAFPLVTIAALQFHARAYPAIISGAEVVRCRASGFEPTPEEEAQALKVGRYMSYQLLEEDTAWEEDHDRLLLNYSIVGCAFKKSYYSGVEGHNVSELVLAQDLVLDYYAKSVETARRKTHVYTLTRNAVLSGIRSNSPTFRDVSKDAWFLTGGITQSPQPRRDGTEQPILDTSTPFRVLEQHCWLDLDQDGFEEPYVVTLEETSHTVLRIVARWEREHHVEMNASGEILAIMAHEYFTKYGFIPAPDGSIYDMGFGVLLGPLNESVSSAINQLLDAGTMSIGAGGFLGRGAKIRGGVYTFAPFEWKRIDSTGDDLHKSIYPLPIREPSAVLFNLLGLLIDYTNRISGATETMVGENPGQNTPAETSRSMVEQGMKVYTAIFKRTWRAMKAELKKLYILNAFFAPPRYRELFLGDPNRICPAADPNIVSDSERFQRAAAIAQRASTVPGYNPAVVEENYLRALRVDDPKKFYVGVDPKSQPEDIKVQIQRLKNEQAMRELQWEQQQFVAELTEERRLNQVEAVRLQAQAELFLAQAAGEKDNLEIVKIQTAMAALKQRDEAIRGRVDHLLKAMELSSEPDRKPLDTGAAQRLVAPPSDSGVPPTPQPTAPGPVGSVGSGPVFSQ
jgi:chaperonin GroES